MLDRQAGFSVATGSHVAIPHGTNDGVVADADTENLYLKLNGLA